MKNLKKICCLMVVAIMAVAMVACGGNSGGSTPTGGQQAASNQPSQEIKSFLDTMGAEFAGGIEEGFESSSGLECTVDLDGDGNMLIVNITMDDLSNVPEDVKAGLEEGLEASASSLSGAMSAVKSYVPAMNAVQFNFLDANGELLASVESPV